MTETIDYQALVSKIKERSFKSFILDQGYSIKRDGKLDGVCPNPACGSGSGMHHSCAFHVYERVGKCFSCGKVYDIIDFVMEVNQISFKDAVRAIASQYGIIDGAASEFIEAVVDEKKELAFRGKKIVFVSVPVKRKFATKADMHRYFKQRDEYRAYVRGLENRHKTVMSMVELTDDSTTLIDLFVASGGLSDADADEYLSCKSNAESFAVFMRAIERDSIVAEIAGIRR